MDHRSTPPSSAGGNSFVTSSDPQLAGRRKGKRDRPSKRRRLPIVALAIAVVVVLVAALTGATSPLQVTRFALSGHWGFNSILHTIFHIDGGTASVDAQAAMPGDQGSQVLQGDTSGFVVGDSKITQFGKSDLSVQQTIAPPAQETPVAVEVVGGPYLVYRNAGKVVRLGAASTIMDTGGAVGDPIATDDGTLWLHRTESGVICELPKDATAVASCPVVVPDKHPGAMTVVDNHPEFLDLATDQLLPFDSKGLGQAVPVGVPVSPQARPAVTDVSGRVAIFDQTQHHLVLADPKPHGDKAVTVPLPDGDYDGPVSNGTSVAMVDRKSDTLLTFGSDGKQQDSKPVPHQQGEPRLSQGEDNHVYVEDSLGTHVLVVDPDGKVQDVPTAGKPSPTTTAAPPSSAQPPPDQGQTGGGGGPTGGNNTPTRQPEPPKPPVSTVNQPPVPASPPGAPPGVGATAGDGSATVTWGTAVDNRAAVTAYHVSWSGGSLDVGGGVRRATVNGLANGTSYVFTVTATNAKGTGPGASSAAVVPFAAATAPVVNATTAGHVSWTTPNLRGGTLVDYVVSGGPSGQQTAVGNSVDYNLAAGQSYTFTVHAVTRFGGGANIDGQDGSASVTVPAKPAPKVTISQGGPASSGNCDPSDCKWVLIHVVGFDGGRTYQAILSSGATSVVSKDSFTTNADGTGDDNNLDYDTRGQTIWVTVGGVKSNELVWP